MNAPLQQTTASFNASLEILPKAVAAVLSLSALGYFIGWREAHAYYTDLGAGWAASSVPPMALLQLSSGTIVTITFAVFFSLILFLDQQISLKKLGWFCAVCIGVAGIFFVASQNLFGDVSPMNAYIFAAVGSFFYAISAGVTLTELIGYFRQSNQKVSSGHLWLVYWFVLSGMFWAPDRLGKARALRDVEPSSSSLSVVELGTLTQPEDWRLVQLLGDKALLMMITDKAHKRRFRLVEAKDVKAFGSTLKPLATKT